MVLVASQDHCVHTVLLPPRGTRLMHPCTSSAAGVGLLVPKDRLWTLCKRSGEAMCTFTVPQH